MKTEAKEILEKLEPLWEMANFGQKWTGLPVWVFASVRMASHGPRIKIGLKPDDFKSHKNCFVVTISDEPETKGNTSIVDNKTLKLILSWVVLNKDLLLKFWNSEIDAGDLATSFRKIDSITD